MKWTLEEMKKDYDWQQAFSGSLQGQEHSWDVYPALPSNLHTRTGPVLLENVEELYGAVEGENEGPPWICYGRENDGRYFYLEAGCDYTGWD